jgi:hypothetical protein
MMSLERAWQHNIHGFGYTDEIIKPDDILGGVVLVSNLPYDDAIKIYHDYQRNLG